MTKPSTHDAQDRPSASPVPSSPSAHGSDPAGPAANPLPSERDEAGNSAAVEPDEKVKQAGQDVARGLRDTSRGEASDAAYQKQK